MIRRWAAMIGIVFLAVAMGGDGRASDPVCVPPPSGMVGWWPGDGNTNDIVGNNNGTAQGGLGFAPGMVGQAFSLNGIDAAVDVGNAPALQVSAGDFSVDAWVQLNALSHPPGSNNGAPQGDMSIVDKMAAPTNANGWRLLKQADNRFWFCFGGGSNHCGDPAFTIFSATHASIGPWFHLAVVKTAVAFSIYVNGVLEDSRATPAFVDTNSTDLLIGAYVLEGSHFNGLIDEVELFHRALTGAEVLAIFNAGSAGKCKCTPASGPPVVAPNLGTTILEDPLEKGAHKAHTQDESLTLHLSDCTGPGAVKDVCGNPLDINTGTITRIDVLPYDEDFDADKTHTAAKDLAETARKLRKKHGGCSVLAFSGSSFTLPLDAAEPQSALLYRVHFTISAGGPSASATCDVRLVDDQKRLDRLNAAGAAPIGCALCIGASCPDASCPATCGP